MRSFDRFMAKWAFMIAYASQGTTLIAAFAMGLWYDQRLTFQIAGVIAVLGIVVSVILSEKTIRKMRIKDYELSTDIAKMNTEINLLRNRITELEKTSQRPAT